jgi:transcriptional regulator with PAS, ATPase and Fis domain
LVRSGKKTDQGALFLDEIGDMPFALQAKLLCFLDQWTVRAVGSASEETVDVQVVSATNSSLEQAVEDRRFRPDLLYRLRGVEITLPPFPHCLHTAQPVKDCQLRLQSRQLGQNRLSTHF